MICTFACLGVALKIGPKHVNKYGESVTLSILTNTNDILHVICAGKILDTVDSKLREGDSIYVYGKLRVDRQMTLNAPKNATVPFADFLTILPKNEG